MTDIENFYREYHKDIYHHLYWLTHDPHLSEELLQETFLEAIKSIHTYRGESSVKTWLYSIARHLWIRGLRKKQIISSEEEISDLIAAGDLEQDFLDRNVIDKIQELLKDKDEKTNLVFRLRLKGYSYLEIAEQAGISENSARVIDFRTKKWLRENLEKEGFI